jgi:prepilin-type processing-associated H-X9-DG protein
VLDCSPWDSASTWTWFTGGGYEHLLRAGRINAVKKASETMLVTECGIGSPLLADWGVFNRLHGDPNNGVVVARHGKYANVLWADGHVSGVASDTNKKDAASLAAGFTSTRSVGKFPYSWGHSTVYPWFWVRENK